MMTMYSYGWYNVINNAAHSANYTLRPLVSNYSPRPMKCQAYRALASDEAHKLLCFKVFVMMAAFLRSFDHDRLSSERYIFLRASSTGDVRQEVDNTLVSGARESTVGRTFPYPKAATRYA